MKVAFFPKYTEKRASSRYRTFQYLKFLKTDEFCVYPLFDDSYVPAAHISGKQSKLYIIKRYLIRLFYLSKYSNFDLIFLEKEFFPFVPYFTFVFKIFKIKYLVDYDDAIFHRYDANSNPWIRKFLSKKISKVIKNAEVVITGSSYLSQYAKKFNKNVIEIPTSIEYKKYADVKVKDNLPDIIIIGWIGSETTSVNLLNLIPVFEHLEKIKFRYELRLIGFDRNLIDNFKNLKRVKFIKWEAITEVKQISQFTVGIMPLEDNKFNKGKCAFKLIQYMACGIPTISSPFESNINVDNGIGNLFANKEEEWVNAFIKIKEMPFITYRSISQLNINQVKTNYSVESNYLKIVATIKSVISN